MSPMVCFLVMFSMDVLHETVNVRDRRSDSPLLALVQGLNNLPNCLFVLCHLGEFAIDPLARHIPVSALLYSWSFHSSMNSGIFGSQISWCFSFIFFSLSLFLVFLCSVDSLILLRTKMTNLYFSSGVFLLHPVLFASPTRGPHTFPRVCRPHLCFHLGRFSESSFIIRVCNACHHLVLLHSYTFIWSYCTF